MGDNITEICKGAFAECTSLPVIDNIRYADWYLVCAADKSATEYKIKDGTRFIAEGAFKGCVNFARATVPASVEFIGDDAFNGCTALARLSLGASLKHIGDKAFYGCSSLTSATMPENLEHIGNYAFASCGKLRTLTLNNNLRHIGNSLILGSQALESNLNVSKSVEHIGDQAFTISTTEKDVNNYKNVTVDFGENLSYIGDYALSGIPNIQSVKIVNPCTVGESAFSECPNLAEVSINTTALSKSCFSNCKNLQTVVFTDDMRSIDDYAFENCTSLNEIVLRPHKPNTFSGAKINRLVLEDDLKEIYVTSSNQVKELTFGDDITIVNESMFKNWTSLETIILGSSMDYIRNDAFYGCSSLKTVVSKNPIPPLCYADVFYKVNKSAATLYVPEDAINEYKADEEWMTFFQILPLDNYIPTGISSISTTTNSKNTRYNINGTKANPATRGVVITNGKKYFVK